MQDQDPRIAVLACKICLMSAPEAEKRKAILRLIGLLMSADYILKQEIERCLASNFDSC
jgi:hypothetical protein